MSRSKKLKVLFYLALLTSIGGVATLAHYVSEPATATGDGEIDQFLIVSDVKKASDENNSTSITFDDATDTIDIHLASGKDSQKMQATVYNKSNVNVQLTGEASGSASNIERELIPPKASATVYFTVNKSTSADNHEAETGTLRLTATQIN
jgi:hypothetical protein